MRLSDGEARGECRSVPVLFICRQGMDLESNWGGNEGKKGCLLRMRRARER